MLYAYEELNFLNDKISGNKELRTSEPGKGLGNESQFCGTDGELCARQNEVQSLEDDH